MAHPVIDEELPSLAFLQHRFTEATECMEAHACFPIFLSADSKPPRKKFSGDNIVPFSVWMRNPLFRPPMKSSSIFAREECRSISRQAAGVLRTSVTPLTSFFFAGECRASYGRWRCASRYEAPAVPRCRRCFPQEARRPSDTGLPYSLQAVSSLSPVSVGRCCFFLSTVGKPMNARFQLHACT